MNTIIAGRFDEQGCAERASGTITQSQWNDFDPLGQPALVSGAG